MDHSDVIKSTKDAKNASFWRISPFWTSSVGITYGITVCAGNDAIFKIARVLTWVICRLVPAPP